MRWVIQLIWVLFVAMAGASAMAQETWVRDRFIALDRDDDGRLREDELPAPRLFEFLDGNGDGKITLSEAAAAIDGLPQARREAMRENLRARGGNARAQHDAYAVHWDVSYIDRAGAPDQATALDIYAPKEGAGRRVLVYVHGGGWKRGDKRHVAEKPAYFVEKHGWVLVSVNYRLLPEGQHPENVRDVAAAIAWVHDHIGDYGGDPDAIWIMGHSAGAHLVALVAADDRRLGAYGKSLSVINGVVVNDTQAFDLPRLIAIRPGFYSAVFTEDEATQRDASPMTHIAAGKHIPPMLIIHNLQSNAESRAAQAHAFQEALGAIGVEARVAAVPDRSHGELNTLMGVPGEATTTLVAEFLGIE